jgi:hypothetical protein
MAPGFDYRRHPRADVWFPVVHSEDRARSVMARLSDDANLEQARAEALRVAQLIEGDAWTPERARYVDAQTLPESVVAFSRGQLHLLIGVVLLTLVVSCSNVANLFGCGSFRTTRERRNRELAGCA